MFNGLVRRAVRANTDAVMGEDENGWNVHQCSEPNRIFHVIAKGEKRGDIRTQSRNHKSIGDGGHRVFTHTEVNVTTGVIGLTQSTRALEFGHVARGEIGTATEKRRDVRGERIDDRMRGVAGTNRLPGWIEHGQVGECVRIKFARQDTFEFVGQVRMIDAIT